MKVILTLFVVLMGVAPVQAQIARQRASTEPKPAGVVRNPEYRSAKYRGCFTTAESQHDHYAYVWDCN